MKWMLCRNLCLIGLSVSFLSGQAPVPADASSRWQALAPGMDIIRVQSRQPSMVGDSKITVLRVDPGLWELEVIGIAQTGETAGHTARDWAQKEKYAAVINAGMFEADNKTHLGYLRSRDHVYNGRVNSYRSVMAFDPHEGKKVPAVRILDLDSAGTDMQSILADYASA